MNEEYEDDGWMRNNTGEKVNKIQIYYFDFTKDAIKLWFVNKNIRMFIRSLQMS